MNFKYAEDEQYNIKDRYKVLYIDKRTMLPVRMYRHMNSLGQKESQEIIITDLKINEGETNEFAFQVPADYNATDAARNTNAADILGKKLPAFISLSLDGKRISSHQLKGKVVLLDFWEVWCGPCIESMPKVQKIYEEYKQKGLLVLGVMSETKKNTVSAASRLIKLKGITFPSILNDHLKNDLKINAVPTYLLINKSGEIVDVQQGFSDELKTSIEKAL
jgi:thiol-disulfide isomerase/thioredoxin